MNCQFSKAEKILAATLCSEARQRSILFVQPFFPAPLRNMLCFSLIYSIITVSFYRVACLWLRKHLTCEHTPVPSLTLKPELFQRHMSTLFHHYFTITSPSLPLGRVCSTLQSLKGEITKIQMKETIIGWAKNKTVDSTLGQSKISVEQHTALILLLLDLLGDANFRRAYEVKPRIGENQNKCQ